MKSCFLLGFLPRMLDIKVTLFLSILFLGVGGGGGGGWGARVYCKHEKRSEVKILFHMIVG